MNTYPALTVSHANFCSLLSEAWGKAFIESNVRSGFEACGIVPFNPAKIPEEAYLPNLLYAGTDSSLLHDNETTIAGDSETAVETEAAACETVCGDNGGITVELGCDSALSDPELPAEEPLSVMFECGGSVNSSILYEDQENIGQQEIEASSAKQNDGEAFHCPSELALAAVEASLSGETLRRYEACFSNGAVIEGDNIYWTWKLYKEKVDGLEIREQPTEHQQSLSFPFNNSSFPGKCYSRSISMQLWLSTFYGQRYTENLSFLSTSVSSDRAC